MIQSIRLQQFRSYQDDSFEFSKGVNIVIGPNASGKTNLLEAILVVATGQSYRVADADLVQYGQEWARLDANTGGSHQRSVKLEYQNGRLKKSFVIDATTYARLSHQKQMPIVLFEPNHLTMLHGTPDLRRDFLDTLLSQLEVGYGAKLAHYRRAVSQRNSLLKKGYQQAKHQAFVWNVRIGELGGYLVERRHHLVRDLSEKLKDLYPHLSKSNTVTTVSYSSKITDVARYGTILHRELEARLETDCVRGFTTLGPHRDDMVIQIDGRAAGEVASRGELRTVLLALKIAEAEMIEQQKGEKPILLFDDVFSELDGARRHALTDFLKDHQAFITTTDADVVTRNFMSNCNIIALSTAREKGLLAET